MAVDVWPSTISKEVRNEIGEREWSEFEQRVRDRLRINVPDLRKNALFIGYVLSDVWERGTRSKELCELCDSIINFASEAKKRGPEEVPNEAVEANIEGLRPINGNA